MKITFLSAEVPLTKTFFLENNELKKVSHPRIFKCTSHEEEIDTIQDLYEALEEHAALGHCFLKGNLNRQLKDESRAGCTDPNEPTWINLLDLDGIKTIKDVPEFMKKIGLGNVDYIVQYSSSMGIVPARGISAHIFVLADKAYSPAILKQWLIHLNLTYLHEDIGLTRTNNALRWPLDITTCQNDKLIYIAPPILGDGVKDEFKGKRIKLVKRTKRHFTLPDVVPSAEANRVASNKVLNELRAKIGLPSRKGATFKTKGIVEYMAKPDEAIVTGIKHERNFVYLNINNGDSWAYYHPQNNPEFIYNFKNEPIYKTSELLPEYWSEVRNEVNKPKPDSSGVIYLAFRDFRTATYWNGTWNKSEQDLNIAQAKSADQLRDFLIGNKQPVGDYIPDWSVSFMPQLDEIVSVDNRTVNLFIPSDYMKLPKRVVDRVPPTIKKIILHALGNDEEAYEQMLNWLAVSYQYRCRPETAWVLHGIQGTGKGLFLNRILRPIFKYVEAKRMRELDSTFNGFMERCLILWVDEAQLGKHSQSNVIAADIKNYITEPVISIRRMHMMPYEAANYMGIIFAGNKNELVVIDPEDRRFNVAAFQDKMLKISDEELELIEGELEDFAQYLGSRKADRNKARTPLNNAAKRKMIHLGMSSIDVVCNAILAGDYQFFWDQRPALHLMQGNVSRDIISGSYIRLIESMWERKILLREEVQLLLEYTIGDTPASTYKFTSKVKHHKIIFEPIYYEGKTVRGIKVNWKVPPDILKEIRSKK